MPTAGHGNVRAFHWRAPDDCLQFGQGLWAHNVRGRGCVELGMYIVQNGFHGLAMYEGWLIGMQAGLQDCEHFDLLQSDSME